MTKFHEIKAVLLDINGTVFPLSASEAAFEELGLDKSLVKV